MQTLLPYQMIVLFGEWGRGDLPVLPPNRALCTDYIFPKYVDRSIQPDWLWEVVAPRGDVYNGLGVRDHDRVLAWRSNHDHIASHRLERPVLALPCPLRVEEAAKPRVSGLNTD